jgi:hypothetical protein
MPLYLVRWPSLVASVVRAQDEDHLRDILDEVASPGDAVWSEYTGPLWVDVALAVTAEPQGEMWLVEGVEDAAAQPLLGARVESEDSDTTSEMFHTVLAKAFPHLYALLAEGEGDGEAEAALDRDAVRRAALADLAR